jgi:ABC-type multidrug transport system permease subunit
VGPSNHPDAPLFFASNAIYPISMLPPWLQVISHINPLTYESVVDPDAGCR